jgi:hypothetical protein
LLRIFFILYFLSLFTSFSSRALLVYTSIYLAGSFKLLLGLQLCYRSYKCQIERAVVRSDLSNRAGTTRLGATRRAAGMHRSMVTQRSRVTTQKKKKHPHTKQIIIKIIKLHQHLFIIPSDNKNKKRPNIKNT